jgi:IS30 family transposase
MPHQYSAETVDRYVALVCSGVSLSEAGRRVGVAKATASRWWAQHGRMDLAVVEGAHGGLLQVVPTGASTSQCRQRLSGHDRSVIAAGHSLGLSYAAIGVLVGRDRSVVWRELHRNRSTNGEYHGPVADLAAAQQRRRPKPFKLVDNPALCRRIEGWMDDGWSPRLIAQMLAVDHGDDHTERVSHETIYQALYVQTRGSLRADLHQQLSLKRRARVPRTRDRRASSPYKEAFKISQRPAEVADRAVAGHWEGDLIVGPASMSAIGTLVERTSRFTILLHLPDRHDANTVAEAMIAQMRHLPDYLRRSITWDRGSELAGYRDIQLALDTTLYFCDPHSPWQRGTNENTNRLLRHWFAKGTDLSIHTAADLKHVADTLNKRPRPTLNLQTPAQALNQLLIAA